LREAAVELSCTKKINPFWWFDSEAEEVAKFYVGIFKNSKIGNMRRSDKLGN
jgi:predicted 3-demethylubiquinone-9 3-methyltransferase (glyoxalase superfamily)